MLADIVTCLLAADIVDLAARCSKSQEAEAVSQCVQKAVMARLAWLELQKEQPEPQPESELEAQEFHTPRAEEGIPPNEAVEGSTTHHVVDEV